MAERGEEPPGREMSSCETPRCVRLDCGGIWKAKEAEVPGERVGVVVMRLKVGRARPHETLWITAK